jgi:hypothetical protein
MASLIRKTLGSYSILLRRSEVQASKCRRTSMASIIRKTLGSYSAMLEGGLQALQAEGM